jgi:deazaflavin-dependent oxidoreductase (nitroreductase family)
MLPTQVVPPTPTRTCNDDSVASGAGLCRPDAACPQRGALVTQRTADRSAHAQPDLRQVVAGQFLRLINPLVRRLIASGLPTGAPNVLLTVRGRRSGIERTIPVGMVELDGRRFIQASYGESGWVQNLRAASGRATLVDRGRQMPVQAVELAPQEGGAILRRLLEPYHFSRVLRALLGPRFRPPIGVLHTLRVRVDDTVEEYAAEAQRHPLFELRPVVQAAG